MRHPTAPKGSVASRPCADRLGSSRGRGYPATLEGGLESADSQHPSESRTHPYHGTTRNRCADRRCPRSCPTVEAAVIGSLSVELCAHFQTGAGHRSAGSRLARGVPPLSRTPPMGGCPYGREGETTTPAVH